MRIAVDIGGTFTDVVLASDDAVIETVKVLTTPDDPLNGIRDGLRALTHANGSTEDPLFLHATTLASNLVIERKGQPVTLFITKGFRDLLHLGDEARYDIYDLDIEFPEPPLALEDVIEVDERTDHEGKVLRPVSLDALDRSLEGRDIHGTVAICFLHAVRNAANEQAVADHLQRKLPERFISASSNVAPEIGEFRRAMTTVVNAYVKPHLKPYLSRLAELVDDELGGHRGLFIMLSHGALAPPDVAGDLAVRMVESGPAAGVLAAHAFLRAAADTLNIGGQGISLDMGGTTAKVAFISATEPLRLDNKLEVARQYQLRQGSGLPLLIPSVDLIEIGAGGGSIARNNELSLLEVGPESASSVPGPACYGRGGTEPTVTDANVVLGYIPSWQRLGGDREVHVDLAKGAMSRLADDLGLSTVAAAAGIYDVANEHMAAAIRVSAAQRGLAPEQHAVIAFGGAAPLHACGVAERVGTTTVVIPPEPGVFSAVGLSLAPLGLESVRAHRAALPLDDPGRVDELYTEMEQEIRDRLGIAGAGDLTMHRSVEMRFVGQGQNVVVPLPDGVIGTARFNMALAEAFRQRYVSLYERYPETTVEAVAWRLRALGETPGVQLRQVDRAARSEIPAQTPAIFPDFHGEPVERETAVRLRANLAPGDDGLGPALIVEDHTTTVVPPNWRWRAGVNLELVITRDV